MRLLPWFLLVTLVTLLGSADSASPTIASTDTESGTTFVDHAAAARALSATSNIKRSLRGDSKTASSVKQFDTDKEERAFSVVSVLDAKESALASLSQGKTQLIKLTNYLDQSKSKVNTKLTNYLYKSVYNAGETPVSLKAKYMGTPGLSKYIDNYKVWWEQVRKTGIAPK